MRKKHAGEEYRLSLLQLIEDLNHEKNVVLLNEFATQKELFKYLYASDIYIYNTLFKRSTNY